MSPKSNQIDKKEPQVEDILSLVRGYSKKDTEIIRKAFDFSRTYHENQKRMSGENYFIHPFETAKILAGLGVGPKTIAAGLLHDTIEDARASEQEIEKEFGKEVLFLVEGVTKLGKLKYRGIKRHSESLRKLFVAMSQDIRVIIIKLADRLHNMKTLEFVRNEKQKRIAEETLEIYAPIAYRLGIGKLKKDLEDLAFPYVYPKEYEKTKELLKNKSKDSQKRLEKIHRTLQRKLAEEGIRILKADFRLKGLYSLCQKLKKNDMDIGKIHDISALRIIVKEISDCYKVLGIIHELWRPLPGRIKDYIADPKSNGYRSIHTTIFTGDGGIAEIQIRTEEMHKEAEFGIASHLSYKGDFKKNNWGLAWIFGLLPYIGPKIAGAKDGPHSKDSDIPNWVKELAEFQADSKQNNFEEDLKFNFFKERIFVFTPKGDVVDLPVGSTSIDFAYAIHSDIGNRMFGAKINGKFLALDTKLKNGDIVEILTRQGSKPSSKWLKDTVTILAQKKIRAALFEEKDNRSGNSKIKKWRGKKRKIK